QRDHSRHGGRDMHPTPCRGGRGAALQWPFDFPIGSFPMLGILRKPIFTYLWTRTQIMGLFHLFSHIKRWQFISDSIDSGYAHRILGSPDGKFNSVDDFPEFIFILKAYRGQIPVQAPPAFTYLQICP